MTAASLQAKQDVGALMKQRPYEAVAASGYNAATPLLFSLKPKASVGFTTPGPLPSSEREAGRGRLAITGHYRTDMLVGNKGRRSHP